MNKNFLVVMLSVLLVVATASHFFNWTGGELPKLDFGLNGLFYAIMVASSMISVVTYTITPNETKDAMKRWWAKMKYKNVYSRISFINPDQSQTDIYVRTKESKFEYEGLPFFINPKKGIRVRGVNTFYFVNKNTVGHDFINDPLEILKKIIKESKDMKKDKDGNLLADITENVHEVWAEPYRFDAKMMKEAITNAQLSATQQLHELMSLFKDKNVVMIAIGILIAAAAAAGFGFMSYNEFQAVEMCRTAAEGVINV